MNFLKRSGLSIFPFLVFCLFFNQLLLIFLHLLSHSVVIWYIDANFIGNYDFFGFPEYAWVLTTVFLTFLFFCTFLWLVMALYNVQCCSLSAWINYGSCSGYANWVLVIQYWVEIYSYVFSNMVCFMQFREWLMHKLNFAWT